MADESGASGQSGGSPEQGGKESGGSPEPGGQGSSGAQTYTQEQLDRFVGEERRRLSSKYADYDQLKTQVAELTAATQTELERAQAKAADAEARAISTGQQLNALLVRSAVLGAAARAGAVDPDVVVALLAESVGVNEKGEIEGDVDKLVATLLEAKPYLVNGNGSGAGHGSADGGVHGRAGSAPAATPSGAMNALLRQP